MVLEDRMQSQYDNVLLRKRIVNALSLGWYTAPQANRAKHHKSLPSLRQPCHAAVPSSSGCSVLNQRSIVIGGAETSVITDSPACPEYPPPLHDPNPPGPPHASCKAPKSSASRHRIFCHAVTSVRGVIPLFLYPNQFCVCIITRRYGTSLSSFIPKTIEVPLPGAMFGIIAIKRYRTSKSAEGIEP